MAPGTFDPVEHEAVGSIDLCGFQISWDFRELIAARRKKEEITAINEHFIAGDRTIMPALNIY